MQLESAKRRALEQNCTQLVIVIVLVFSFLLKVRTKKLHSCFLKYMRL